MRLCSAEEQFGPTSSKPTSQRGTSFRSNAMMVPSQLLQIAAITSGGRDHRLN